MVGATYSGNLIAFLTVQLQEKPFHSMAEMLQQDQYRWGVLSSSYQHAMLGVGLIDWLMVVVVAVMMTMMMIDNDSNTEKMLRKV